MEMRLHVMFIRLGVIVTKKSYLGMKFLNFESNNTHIFHNDQLSHLRWWRFDNNRFVILGQNPVRVADVQNHSDYEICKKMLGRFITQNLTFRIK